MHCSWDFPRACPPVISFNYGSQNHQQLRQVFKTSLISRQLPPWPFSSCTQLGGSLVVEIFARRGTPVYELARLALMIFACSFLFPAHHLCLRPVHSPVRRTYITPSFPSCAPLAWIITSLLVLPFIIGDGPACWLAIPIAEDSAESCCVFISLRKYRTK